MERNGTKQTRWNAGKMRAGANRRRAGGHRLMATLNREKGRFFRSFWGGWPLPRGTRRRCCNGLCIYEVAALQGHDARRSWQLELPSFLTKLSTQSRSEPATVGACKFCVLHSHTPTEALRRGRSVHSAPTGRRAPRRLVSGFGVGLASSPNWSSTRRPVVVTRSRPEAVSERKPFSTRSDTRGSKSTPV